MGAWVSSILAMARGHKEVRILMVGLDGAGKTTVLYKLKLGDVITTVPTIGFNVETVEYKNISFNVWDIGGQAKIRSLWHYYFRDTTSIIYVVDSSDRERIEEAAEELTTMLNAPELADATLLVLANKQDLPKAASAGELAHLLGVDKFRGRTWHVQACNALTGDGLFEGMDWLAKSVKRT